MNLKHVLAATAAVGILAIGPLSNLEKADASVSAQNGIILNDSSRLLQHTLVYVDILEDPHADPKTKAQIKKYFADKGLYTIKDIIQKAQQDDLNISGYEHYLK